MQEAHQGDGRQIMLSVSNNQPGVSSANKSGIMGHPLYQYVLTTHGWDGGVKYIVNIYT